MFSPLIRRLRAFSRNTEGTVTVEFALYVPLLLWLFAAIYTYFDAFRQETVNLKAAYTISDLISRETTTLNETYIDSMYKMSQLLIRSDSAITLRISVVRWDEDNNRYYVDWSKVRGESLTAWTDATISAVEDDLPTMPDEERVILVETRNEMSPAFRVGLPELDINNFVFTRPRFAPLVHFEGNLSSGGGHDDGSDALD
ncbi:TadE/TadG family type IV pilus assembly protein [Pseudophaeobacter arcticus]|jgi:Flp pilus assembly protein TadG|uniref:TadE/TadG family type IV pilus assembly protein n=1 Tax=Pseudophaeobacter arcticus TaxID=385492 RepID=UPI00041147C6|nr:pilus assembly protein [Pseudophaeobacter arcticus]